MSSASAQTRTGQVHWGTREPPSVRAAYDRLPVKPPPPPPKDTDDET
jgi:hypothetical protein